MLILYPLFRRPQDHVFEDAMHLKHALRSIRYNNFHKYTRIVDNLRRSRIQRKAFLDRCRRMPEFAVSCLLEGVHPYNYKKSRS